MRKKWGAGKTRTKSSQRLEVDESDEEKLSGRRSFVDSVMNNDDAADDGIFEQAFKEQRPLQPVVERQEK